MCFLHHLFNSISEQHLAKVICYSQSHRAARTTGVSNCSKQTVLTLILSATMKGYIKVKFVNDQCIEFNDVSDLVY